jgi:hypothetical protein
MSPGTSKPEPYRERFDGPCGLRLWLRPGCEQSLGSLARTMSIIAGMIWDRDQLHDHGLGQ